MHRHSIHTIGGGYNNSIAPNAEYGSILGGSSNQIQNFIAPVNTPPIHNLIASGSGNVIQHNAHHSVILSGNNNVMDDHFSLILGGENNTIEGPIDPTSYNMISNGVNNRIKSNANHSSIIGGLNNTINPGISGSVILGSYGLTATQSNTVYLRQIAFPDGSIQTTASGGVQIFTAGTGSQAAVNNLSGGNNAQAQSSLIASGNGNLIDANASYGIIMGGTANQIQNDIGSAPHYNMIGTGIGNLVANTADHSYIASGQYNRVAGKQSVILSGTNNKAQAASSFIGSGNNNNIFPNAEYGVILSGENNQIQNILAPLPTGPENKFNFISSGQNNVVEHFAHHSSIIGGSNNRIIQSVANSVILGGTNITATASNTVYMQNISVSSLAGVGDRAMMVDANGNLKTSTILQSPLDPWKSGGNDLSADPTAFLGTTGANDLVFKTDGVEHMRITSSGHIPITAHPGNVGIGTDNPEKKLHVVTTQAIMGQ